MLTQEKFLARIERFLEARGMAPTTFGTKSLDDPNFVFDLRAGNRSVHLRTIEKVQNFMKSPKRRVKQ